MKPGQGQRSAAADAMNSSSAATGEEAGLDYADGYLHRSQAIHSHSSKECILSLEAAFAIREGRTI
jgi:hypothetical protein